MDLSSISPRLDLDFLLQLVGGDLDIARELVDSLRKDGRQLADDLEVALGSSNAVEVARIGHALKGVAASLGAHGLQKAGAELQLLGEASDLSECPRLHRSVVREVLALEHYLASYRAA